MDINDVIVELKFIRERIENDNKIVRDGLLQLTASIQAVKEVAKFTPEQLVEINTLTTKYFVELMGQFRDTNQSEEEMN